MKIINVLCGLWMLGGLAAFASENDSLYHETYRSQYHFSPKEGWIGDPCGFMFYQGKYHMYWWGKVESSDLVHFNEITPYAMIGADPNISYFTGSAVIDKNNTVGNGKDAFIAAYTSFEKDSRKQAQSISFSHDGGKTFHYYDGNPVLDIWSTEFRDPTVIWHEPTQKWVMVVAKALEKKVKFYTSPNLKDWTWTSDFGPAGNSEKSWECPDLFQVSVDGNPNQKKWVMVISINWAQVQYFIGDFDGTSFTLMKNHPTEPLYLDKGLDYYAPRTFQDYDGTLDTSIQMGWIATWDYAQHVPSQYGKGFWSIPRVLDLKTCPEGIRLVQQPIKALESLREQPKSISRNLAVGTHTLKEFSPLANQYELDVEFSVDKPNMFGFNLCVGNGKKLVVSYDTESCNLVIDRTNCAAVDITKFARMAYSKVNPMNGKVRFRIFVDKSSVEVFANDGRDVFTLLTYPSEAQIGIEVFAHRLGTHMDLKAWTLKSIWNNVIK